MTDVEYTEQAIGHLENLDPQVADRVMNNALVKHVVGGEPSGGFDVPWSPPNADRVSDLSCYRVGFRVIAERQL